MGKPCWLASVGAAAHCAENTWIKWSELIPRPSCLKGTTIKKASAPNAP